MSGHEKKPLVPPLRFPEFRDAGEWESKPLKFMGSFFRGLTYSADEVSEEGLLVLRSSNIQDGTLVLDKDLVFVNKTCPDDIQLRSGDIAICMSNGSKALVGKNAEFRGNYDHDLTVGAFCSIFRPSVEFSKLIFQTPKYTKFISVAIGGGNINNLKNSDLGEFEHPVPKLQPEQKKIADCLSSLDDLIAEENQKLDTLKTHKKGLMQQLFPREGETVPRLRFPEFRNLGEWKEKSISDFGEIITGSTPSTAHPEFYGGGIPFVSPADISDLRWVSDTKTTLSALGFEKTRPIKANSVLFVCIGSTIGKVTQNVRDCATNQQINSVIPNSEHSGGFVYYVLSLNAERIAKLAGIQAVPIINKTQFSAVRLLVPEFSEQDRIANCFSSLDDFIAAQSQKIDVLMIHKKGLMEQLFPVISEVG